MGVNSDRPDIAALVDAIKMNIDSLGITPQNISTINIIWEGIDVLYELITIGDIDIVVAMRDTIECADEAKMPPSGPLSYRHIISMLDKIELGGFSYTKQCRWLGWMQCAIVAAGCATLEDMKAINMRHKRNA